MERATVFENVQLGPESTGARGIAVPADRLLQALMINFTAELSGRRIRPGGNKLDTRVAPGRRSGTGSLDDSSATFEEVCIPLESIFGVVAPSTPGGATLARDRLYSMNTRGPDTFRSYTIEKGSAAGASRITHGVFTGLTMTGNTEEVTISGDMIGRMPERGVTMTTNTAEVQTITSTASGGTMTIMIGGQTTGTIAFNASSGAIQSALEALSNVAPGDITVTGGVLGTNPVVLTYPINGAFPGNQPNATLNTGSLTGGTATIVQTTQGAKLASLPENVMDPAEVLITVDDSYGAIGTTALERDLSWTFGISDKYAPLWVVNRLNNGTWPVVIEKAVDATLGLVMAADSQSSEFLDRFDAGSVAYVRIDIAGPEIESGQAFNFRADFAASVENLSEGDQDDVWADTWGLRMVDDPNIPGVRIRVRNGVATL